MWQNARLINKRWAYIEKLVCARGKEKVGISDKSVCDM
jgi:hypothetical protein